MKVFVTLLAVVALLGGSQALNLGVDTDARLNARVDASGATGLGNRALSSRGNWGNAGIGAASGPGNCAISAAGRLGNAAIYAGGSPASQAGARSKARLNRKVNANANVNAGASANVGK